MRGPPYARQVMQAPQGYWQRGCRVMVFAGPEAWSLARWWLDDSDDCGLLTVMRARWRYTLVLPPDQTALAAALRWPVYHRDVVVVDTGAGEEALQPLIGALQRDGCTGGEIHTAHVRRAPRRRRRDETPAPGADLLLPFSLEAELQALQPEALFRCDWDAEVRDRRDAILAAKVRHTAEQLADVLTCDVPGELVPSMHKLLGAYEAGSMGAWVADVLAERMEPAA